MTPEFNYLLSLPTFLIYLQEQAQKYVLKKLDQFCEVFLKMMVEFLEENQSRFACLITQFIKCINSGIIVYSKAESC